MNPERKYVAVSIKHSEYKWKFGMPLVLWGYHITKDDDKRCFGGYTTYLDHAERYCLGDFARNGYTPDVVKDDEPVPLEINFCKKWKKYDTVLVDAERYYHYCVGGDIAMHPPVEAYKR